MIADSCALVRVPAYRAPTYVRYAVLNPIGLSAVALGTCLAAIGDGVIGGLIAVPLIASAGACLALLAPIRRAIERHIAAREREERARERLERLEAAGALRKQQFGELRELVDGVESVDPNEARRLQLQDLLDEFVRLAVAQAGCERAAGYAGSLPRKMAVLEPRDSALANTILARRIRHRDECTHRSEELADQLEAIDQLVRLIAERVACPPLEHDLDGEIERRLSELEQLDDALEQLSA